jgi:hypothetical protein
VTPRARPGPRRTARSAGRGGTALLYRGLIGTRRTVAAGLLQSTSLPVIVSASVIGVDLGVISAATSAALVGAGPVLSCSRCWRRS